MEGEDKKYTNRFGGKSSQICILLEDFLKILLEPEPRLADPNLSLYLLNMDRWAVGRSPRWSGPEGEVSQCGM